jgi:hypothetical protein
VYDAQNLALTYPHFLQTLEMANVPLGEIATEAAYDIYLSSLRPTTIVPLTLRQNGLPLRVIDCGALVRRNELRVYAPNN